MVPKNAPRSLRGGVTVKMHRSPWLSGYSDPRDPSNRNEYTYIVKYSYLAQKEMTVQATSEKDAIERVEAGDYEHEGDETCPVEDFTVGVVECLEMTDEDLMQKRADSTIRDRADEE